MCERSGSLNMRDRQQPDIRNRKFVKLQVTKLVVRNIVLV